MLNRWSDFFLIERYDTYPMMKNKESLLKFQINRCDKVWNQSCASRCRVIAEILHMNVLLFLYKIMVLQ